MPCPIIRRPDGRWAVFSTIVDDFMVDEATEDEVVAYFVMCAVEDTTRDVLRRIEQAKTRSRPGEHLIPSYEEACAERDAVHGRED